MAAARIQTRGNYLKRILGICLHKMQITIGWIVENSDSKLEGEDGWRRVACDAKSNYAWKIQVSTGKLADGHPEKNQGMRVVLDLTEGLRGHNVTCDNFFTSYQLGQQLLKRKITMVGTARKNKPELPPALLASKQREVFSSKFAFTHPLPL
ncbi:unnamed protein product [Lepeophtheirus salmonis]|uniref:(salmon louse) hypothetical protein n=1 Tax=Lepeophtheirus salmonis TaxID=72036 RepID=A0A7R8CEM7_LEPSM|nr:unnamed protein product [Lepeophtheirus salmonis]CAF2797061.1 unnamed protein product [Lepeophtheirus salmonis]